MLGMHCASWAALALCAPAVAAGKDSGNRTVFGTTGLSPAAAGQTLAQAEKALREPLQAEAAPADAQACHYRRAASLPGVRYAVSQGVLTRVETRDARYATTRSLHVGDTTERVRKAYGKRLVSTPHPYFAKGLTMTIYAADKRSALVMESNDEGRIITLRGGRVPEVTWLEACS